MKYPGKINLFFFATFLFSQEIYDSTYFDVHLFDEDRFKNIIIHIEPFQLNSYILNKYYPLQIIDYRDNGYIIDGAMNLPIYRSISENRRDRNSSSFL